MKAADCVGLTWAALTVTLWCAAGYEAANGITAAAFAYSVVPFALMPAAGLIMGDLERRRTPS